MNNPFFMKKVILFGADPEAVLWDINNNCIIGAHSAGFPGHGSVSVKKEPQLKCDGASSTFEIETPPFTNPEAGVEIFRQALIKLANYESHNLDFFGGAMIGNICIGGHIHFSLPRDDMIVRVLDRTIGHLSFLVSGKNQWERVKSSRYGRYGNTETKPYGFEYRTPPSWLISEEWTLAFLSLSYTVAHAFNENKSKVYSKLDAIHNEKIPKRYKFLKALRYFKEDFPHVYYGRHLSPIYRTITSNKTWKAISKPKYENCCLKRWKL